MLTYSTFQDRFQRTDKHICAICNPSKFFSYLSICMSHLCFSWFTFLEGVKFMRLSMIDPFHFIAYRICIYVLSHFPDICNLFFIPLGWKVEEYCWYKHYFFFPAQKCLWKISDPGGLVYLINSSHSSTEFLEPTLGQDRTRASVDDATTSKKASLHRAQAEGLRRKEVFLISGRAWRGWGWGFNPIK